MDDGEIPEQRKRQKTVDEDAKEAEKLLTIVVNRRKTVPAKCMEYMKQVADFEICLLENAKVYVQENKDRENFKRIVQSLKRFKSFQFSCTDLHAAENKIKKFYKKTTEMNNYLQNRKQYIK